MRKYSIVKDPTGWIVYKEYIIPNGQIGIQVWPEIVVVVRTEQEAIDFVLMRKLEE